MASVTLVKGNDTLTVTTARAFVDAVYNKGWLPQTGSVDANYEALVTGGVSTGADLRYVISSNGTIRDSIVLKQSEYDALPFKDPTTQYIVLVG